MRKFKNPVPTKRRCPGPPVCNRSDKKLQTTEVFEDIQNKIAKIMVDDFNQTREATKEFNADALGILEYLYKFHPKIYKEVEKDWDSIFPYIDIEVDVDVKIRRRGLSDY